MKRIINIFGMLILTVAIFAFTFLFGDSMSSSALSKNMVIADSLPTINLGSLREQPQKDSSGAEVAKTASQQSPLTIVLIVIGVLILVGLVAILIVVLKNQNKGNKKDQREKIVKQTHLPDEETVSSVVRNQTVKSNTNIGATNLWSDEDTNDEEETVVLEDISSHKVFKAVISDYVTIGRVSGDIILDFDQAVSGKHCEILKKDGAYFINDLDSNNGTIYMGEKITEETAIMSGAVVQIGFAKYRISFEKKTDRYK